MNFEFHKTDKLNDISVDNNVDIYQFKLDGTIIGYSLIKKNNLDNNSIYIKIYDKYQSNGYGNKLFKESLNILKNNNIKNVIFNINLENYKMINIISKYNPLNISTVDGVKEFLINLTYI